MELGKNEIQLLSCGWKCSVSLPHSALGWSVVCDCGISWSTYLYFALAWFWNSDAILLRPTLKMFLFPLNQPCFMGRSVRKHIFLTFQIQQVLQS